MRGFSVIVTLLCALNVVAVDPVGGELRSDFIPSVDRGSLSERDLGLLVPTRDSTPAMSPAFSPKRDGLVETRQNWQCVNSGYGRCPGKNYCCPLGGRCCTAGSCCGRGYSCCRSGRCCPNTHNCVIVGGREGCCLKGRTCTGSSNACVDPGYVKCPGQDFCCRPGNVCYRDSDGTPRCGTSSNGNPRTSFSTTVVTTTVIRTSVRTEEAEAEATEIEIEDPFTDEPDVQTTAGGGVPTTMITPTLPTSVPRSSSSSSTSSRSSSAANTGFQVSSASSVGCSTRTFFTAAMVGIIGTFVLA